MDSRAILRMDLGFHIGGFDYGPYNSPCMGSLSFWLTRNTGVSTISGLNIDSHYEDYRNSHLDRSSCALGKQDCGRVLLEGTHPTCHPVTKRVRQMILEGKIGRPWGRATTRPQNSCKLTWKWREAAEKTTIVFVRSSINFHVNLGEGIQQGW